MSTETPRTLVVGKAEALSADLDELLTVDDVAAILKVPKSWVYERTRRRGKERLAFLKLGKYVRFEAHTIRAFVAAQRKSP